MNMLSVQYTLIGVKPGFLKKSKNKQTSNIHNESEAFLLKFLAPFVGTKDANLQKVSAHACV